MAIYKLGELINVSTGNMNKEDQVTDGEYDFFVRSQNKLKANTWTVDGEYVIIPGEGIFIPQYSIGKVAIHQRVYYINTINKDILSTKYLFYWWLKNNGILYKNAVGSTVKSLRKSNFIEPLISLPNIDIQNYIINIIEPFEKMNNLINNKIIAIKKTLNFNFLENESNNVRLSEISKIVTGKRNANFSRENGKFRFYTCSTKLYQFCDSYSFSGEYLVVNGNGDVGNVVYTNSNFDAYQRNYVISCNKFLGNVYWSIYSKKEELSNNSKGSVLKFITINQLENIDVSTNDEQSYINELIIKSLFLLENIKLKLDKLIKKIIDLKIN